MLKGTPSAFLTLCAISVVAATQSAATAADVAGKRITIHQELLKIYLASGKQGDAQGEYQILLGLTPSDAALQFDYAKYLTRKGDYGGALLHYRAAAKAQPFNPDYQGELGSALLRAKDYTGAIEPLRRGGAKYGSQLQLDMQYLQQLKEIQKYNDTMKQRAKDNQPY